MSCFVFCSALVRSFLPPPPPSPTRRLFCPGVLFSFVGLSVLFAVTVFVFLANVFFVRLRRIGWTSSFSFFFSFSLFLFPLLFPSFLPFLFPSFLLFFSSLFFLCFPFFPLFSLFLMYLFSASPYCFLCIFAPLRLCRGWRSYLPVWICLSVCLGNCDRPLIGLLAVWVLICASSGQYTDKSRLHRSRSLLAMQWWLDIDPQKYLCQWVLTLCSSLDSRPRFGVQGAAEGIPLRWDIWAKVRNSSIGNRCSPELMRCFGHLRLKRAQADGICSSFMDSD